MRKILKVSKKLFKTIGPFYWAEDLATHLDYLFLERKDNIIWESHSWKITATAKTIPKEASYTRIKTNKTSSQTINLCQPWPSKIYPRPHKKNWKINTPNVFYWGEDICKIQCSQAKPQCHPKDPLIVWAKKPKTESCRFENSWGKFTMSKKRKNVDSKSWEIMTPTKTMPKILSEESVLSANFDTLIHFSAILFMISTIFDRLS